MGDEPRSRVVYERIGRCNRDGCPVPLAIARVAGGIHCELPGPTTGDEQVVLRPEDIALGGLRHQKRSRPATRLVDQAADECPVRQLGAERHVEQVESPSAAGRSLDSSRLPGEPGPGRLLDRRSRVDNRFPERKRRTVVIVRHPRRDKRTEPGPDEPQAFDPAAVTEAIECPPGVLDQRREAELREVTVVRRSVEAVEALDGHSATREAPAETSATARVDGGLERRRRADHDTGGG